MLMDPEGSVDGIKDLLLYDLFSRALEVWTLMGRGSDYDTQEAQLKRLLMPDVMNYDAEHLSYFVC